MQISTILSTLALALPATAYWKGFNLAAQVPSTGAAKTQQDWENDFRHIISLPGGGWNAARVYASDDYGTLANAVPAALATGMKLLVGVWTEDGNHYNNEKNALINAINTYGHSWIAAVSVGSEDLYRANTVDSTLAQQVYDVRGLLTTLIPANEMPKVGHVDTWTAWVTNATQTIQACDFIGTDGYPYFQSSPIDQGFDAFYYSVDQVRNAVSAHHPGAEVWITESGWPVSGPSVGAAQASQPNAQTYWKQVACVAFGGANTFWYTLQDYTSSPSFGVLDQNYNPLIDLTC